MCKTLSMKILFNQSCWTVVVTYLKLVEEFEDHVTFSVFVVLKLG